LSFSDLKYIYNSADISYIINTVGKYVNGFKNISQSNNNNNMDGQNCNFYE